VEGDSCSVCILDLGAGRAIARNAPIREQSAGHTLLGSTTRARRTTRNVQNRPGLKGRTRSPQKSVYGCGLMISHAGVPKSEAVAVNAAVRPRTFIKLSEAIRAGEPSAPIEQITKQG
jgi:hypothetical protein